MKLQGMFRLPKNRKFGFQPRYYDEAKEELDYRVSRAKQEANGADNENYVPLQNGELRRNSRLLADDKKSSSLRVLFILAVLLGIAYWLFFT